jgi:sirohydrochlorin ferrochelatase
MLTHGSNDPAASEVCHRLRYALQTVRPNLEIQAAFIDQCPPSGPQVVAHLASRGVTEIVFVPLHISSVTEHHPVVTTLVSQMRQTHPELSLALASPLGPEAALLNPLDDRLRSALGMARATEIDGLVLLAEAPIGVRGLSMLSRRARQWGAHHRLPCILASDDPSTPSVAAAIETLNAQGRRHIGVGSFYLCPNQQFESQAHIALRGGAIAVSAPIGIDDVVLDLILARYAFAAMELLDHDNLSAGANAEVPLIEAITAVA